MMKIFSHSFNSTTFYSFRKPKVKAALLVLGSSMSAPHTKRARQPSYQTHYQNSFVLIVSDPITACDKALGSVSEPLSLGLVLAASKTCDAKIVAQQLLCPTSKGSLNY